MPDQSCPWCRYKKKKCERSSSDPTRPCKGCQSSINTDINTEVPKLEFPEKAIERFFPYPEGFTSGFSTTWKILDSRAYKIFGVRLMTEDRDPEAQTDPIESATLIAAHLYFLYSACLPSNITKNGDLNPAIHPEIDPTTTLVRDIIMRIRVLFTEFLLKTRLNENPDRVIFAAEHVLHSQLIAFRSSLEKGNGHLLESAPKKLNHPLVIWFASLEKHFSKRSAENCGVFRGWVKMVSGPIHNLPRHYHPCSLSIVLQQGDHDTRTHHEYNVADGVEGQDHAAVGPPFHSGHMADFPEFSGHPENTIPGVAGPTNWNQICSNPDFQGDGHNLNPPVDTAHRNGHWDMQDAEIAQATASSIHNIYSSTAFHQTDGQYFGAADPPLPMVEMTHQPGISCNNPFYQDFNNLFTSSQANNVPATSRSMFPTPDTMNFATIDDNDLNPYSLNFWGPYDSSLT